jgi:hypothetical protein
MTAAKSTTTPNPMQELRARRESLLARSETLAGDQARHRLARQNALLTSDAGAIDLRATNDALRGIEDEQSGIRDALATLEAEIAQRLTEQAAAAARAHYEETQVAFEAALQLAQARADAVTACFMEVMKKFPPLVGAARDARREGIAIAGALEAAALAIGEPSPRNAAEFRSIGGSNLEHQFIEFVIPLSRADVFHS